MLLQAPSAVSEKKKTRTYVEQARKISLFKKAAQQYSVTKYDAADREIMSHEISSFQWNVNITDLGLVEDNSCQSFSVVFL